MAHGLALLEIGLDVLLEGRENVGVLLVACDELAVVESLAVVQDEAMRSVRMVCECLSTGCSISKRMDQSVSVNICRSRSLRWSDSAES